MNKQIIWNGCDGYVEVENLRYPDDRYETEGNHTVLFTHANRHTAFDVVEITNADVPVVDGEQDFDGLFVTNSGRIYRAN